MGWGFPAIGSDKAVTVSKCLKTDAFTCVYILPFVWLMSHNTPFK